MRLDCVLSGGYDREFELGEYVHEHGCQSVSELFVDLLLDMRSGHMDVSDLYTELFNCSDLLDKARYFCEVSRTNASIQSECQAGYDPHACSGFDEMLEYWRSPGATDGLML
ncbi:MAG: hypothetical protein HDQ88_00915 [Clostridia bacterium]|nr:hypothetical protein [Clostridia bacterium]